ncbi:MAG: NAD(P)/FAD-dependent oxidoreductase [Pseudomonadota bacterium]
MMAPLKLEADYVIVGTGAVGMAFADIIIHESDASVILIDSFAKPGGHWNDAYPFVQLHQPAAYYGVSSRKLDSGRREQGNLNNGLHELSSGAALLAYYDDIMRQDFLPTGRVQYFPMCDFDGENTFTSKVTGEVYEVEAGRALVDCTFLKTTVPKTHTPNFTMDDAVRFMPLNDLPTMTDAPDGFVVIGGGKTGLDACLWLLQNGVSPEDIRWVLSRDAWWLDRENTQPTVDFFDQTMGTQAAMMESVGEAESMEDMFDRLEACGYFLRLHDERPTMFHGATISRAERDEIRKIKGVIRKGYVTHIGLNEIALVEGSIPTTPNTVHVDCSASALQPLEPRLVFNNGTITPQMIRPYQPVFSAALTAHIELNLDDEAKKNMLCTPVALPDADSDFIRFTSQGFVNQYLWSQEPTVRDWMDDDRLAGPAAMMRDVSPDDEEKMAVIKRIRRAGPAAIGKLNAFKERYGLE